MKISWYIAAGGHGYATVGEKLKRAVEHAGAESLPLESFDWDALIAVHPPTRAHLVGPSSLRHDLVLHTMCETDHIPDSWVTLLNRVGLIWVPSRFSERVFRDCGVERPMIRTPYAVEGTPVRRQDHDGPFRVLAWGDSLRSRKKIQSVIGAFIAADLPDATLDVKLNIGPVALPDLHWTDQQGRKYDNITIYHGDWNKNKLQKWIEQGDVGVYLSGGEGYGLMPKEMMASGLPMISVVHTGLSEYLEHAPILYVPSILGESNYFNQRFHTPEAREYQPDIEVAIGHLQWAYAHRELVYDMGMRGAAHVLTTTWDAIGQEAYHQLCEHYLA